MINNNWKYENRKLFTSTDNYKLPDYNWQVRTELVNNFNNQLVKGFSQGLSIRNPEQDVKLFNNLNLEAISTENVNFDKVNEITQKNYSHNDDIYHNARSSVAGFVDQVNKTGEDTVDNIKQYIKDLFNIDTTNLKIYGGILILFYILNK